MRLEWIGRGRQIGRAEYVAIVEEIGWKIENTEKVEGKEENRKIIENYFEEKLKIVAKNGSFLRRMKF